MRVGIKVIKLTPTPKIKANNKTKANEPSNFQLKKVTVTGIVFWSAKITANMAISRPTTKNSNIF